MNIPFVSGQLWKIATGAAGIVALILMGLLIASNFENRDLMKQRNAAIAQINDPKTGFVAQLAQSRTNVATLQTALNTQRQSFETKAKERDAILAETQAKLDAAQAQTHVMEVKLSSFLATKPKGATLEDRVRDIDARGLSEMVK